MRMNERQASAIQDVFRKLAFIDTEPVDLPNSGLDWQETVEIIYRLFTLRWMEFWPQKEITDEDIWEYCQNLAYYNPNYDLQKDTILMLPGFIIGLHILTLPPRERCSILNTLIPKW